MKYIPSYCHQLLVTLCLACLPLLQYAQTRRALLIGLSHYETGWTSGVWPDIHGAHDARLLERALRQQQFTDITLLVNHQATCAHILQQIAALAARTQPGDIIFFHFSGHGQPYEDIDGDEGPDDGWDESLVPYDAARLFLPGEYEGQCHLTDDHLYTLFNTLRRQAGARGEVYAVIDACYSGSSMRGDSDTASVTPSVVGFCLHGYRPYAPRRKASSFRQLPSEPGSAPIVALQSSMPYQRSREITVGGQPCGPLTHYVVASLQKNTIGSGTAWIRSALQLFRSDRRLYRQQVYCESSIPL